MADRIAATNNGAIEQIGSQMQLYDHPRSLFVASFIGAPGINMIEGTLTDGGFVTPEGIVLPVERPLRAANGTMAIYGIRPEQVTISGDGLPAAVSAVESIGPETHVVVKLAGQKAICVCRDGEMFRSVKRSTLASMQKRFTSSRRQAVTDWKSGVANDRGGDARTIDSPASAARP